MKVVIIGGAVAGVSAAARLRHLDEQAEIILIEKGPDVAIARCGLPYYVGEVVEQGALRQSPAEFARAYAVDVRVEQTVVSLSRMEQSIHVEERTSGRVYTESYDVLILATGARPAVPEIEGTDAPGVFSLRSPADAAMLEQWMEAHHPQTVSIIGAGMTGLSLVENLHARDLHVTLIEQHEQIFAPLDIEMAAQLQQHLEDQGVSVLTHSPLKRIHCTLEGLEIEFGCQTLPTDMVILATGMVAESELARQAGLALGAKNAIVVDEHMRTADARIYAVGDVVQTRQRVTGQWMHEPLAVSAARQGRIAADAICGRKSRYTGTQTSVAVQTFGQIAAATGANERQLKQAGIAYQSTIVSAPHRMAYIPNAQPMMIKALYAPKDGKLLGAQVWGGRGADKRCDVLAGAMSAGRTIYDCMRMEFAYTPLLSAVRDPINLLGQVAENQLSGLFQPFRIRALLEQEIGSYTLLDVRTIEEYAQSSMPGATHIPYEILREQYDTLPWNKPIYLFSQTGRRAYLAARILQQNGFAQVYVLDGGYTVYRALLRQARTIAESNPHHEEACPQCGSHWLQADEEMIANNPFYLLGHAFGWPLHACYGAYECLRCGHTW